jgi:hypothetical protein
MPHVKSDVLVHLYIFPNFLVLLPQIQMLRYSHSAYKNINSLYAKGICVEFIKLE